MTTGKAAAKGVVVRRQIRSESGLDRAIATLDNLLNKDSLSPTEERKVEELAKAIREYEQEHYPESDLTQAEQLAHLLQLHALTIPQLASNTGVKLASLRGVLNDTGRFSEEEAGKIASYFSLKSTTFSAVAQVKQEPLSVNIINVFDVLGGVFPVLHISLSSSSDRARIINATINSKIQVTFPSIPFESSATVASV